VQNKTIHPTSVATGCPIQAWIGIEEAERHRQFHCRCHMPVEVLNLNSHLMLVL
jgi:hypothetical protein